MENARETATESDRKHARNTESGHSITKEQFLAVIDDTGTVKSQEATVRLSPRSRYKGYKKSPRAATQKSYFFKNDDPMLGGRAGLKMGPKVGPIFTPLYFKSRTGGPKNGSQKRPHIWAHLTPKNGVAKI